MKITKLSILAFLFAFGVFACTSGSDENSENKDSVAVEEIPEVEVKKIDYPLNNPVEISKMLNQAGAAYTTDVTNSSKNIDKYMTEKDKALALGIYGADLAYVSTYNKSQEINLLFEVCKKISDELGISNIYDEATLAKIEANIENKDTLHSVISNSFHGTYETLQESGKGAVSVLVLAGGWVEGLYISLELTQNAIDKKKMMSGIASQKLNLDKLMVAMELYADNEAVKATIAELQKIEAVYAKINPETLTPAQLKELAKVTATVRAAMVK
jgi:hypothetical protein